MLFLWVNFDFEKCPCWRRCVSLVFLVSPPVPAKSPEVISLRPASSGDRPLQCVWVRSAGLAGCERPCVEHGAPSPRSCPGHPGESSCLPAISLLISLPCWATWGTIIASTLSSDIPTFKHLLSHCFPHRITISATLGVSLTANLLIRQTHFRKNSWGGGRRCECGRD